MSAESIMPLSYFKAGGKYTGQVGDKRYLVERQEDYLSACVWDGPLCFDATEDEEKTFERFELSEEGRQQVISWLNEK